MCLCNQASTSRSAVCPGVATGLLACRRVAAYWTRTLSHRVIVKRSLFISTSQSSSDYRCAVQVANAGCVPTASHYHAPLVDDGNNVCDEFPPTVEVKNSVRVAAEDAPIEHSQKVRAERSAK